MAFNCGGVTERGVGMLFVVVAGNHHEPRRLSRPRIGGLAAFFEGGGHAGRGLQAARGRAGPRHER